MKLILRNYESIYISRAGAQFVGMGKELYDRNSQAKELFQQANNILGFNITEIMFEGDSESLKKQMLHNLLYLFTPQFLEKSMII
ncbi:MAG: hypothetical protein CM15mP129_00970 [Chloroflexota bacterium]|nr:MAG: hypothetical protein CM15mP129_00970 [Chloroflexota bacterium]